MTVIKNRMTNTEFSKQDKAFLAACEQAGVTVTCRQASKFRNKKGTAFRKGRVKS